MSNVAESCLTASAGCCNPITPTCNKLHRLYRELESMSDDDDDDDDVLVLDDDDDDD